MLRALLLAEASWPLDRCPRNAGRAIAARMPMIRMTTSNSIRVKPRSPALISVCVERSILASRQNANGAGASPPRRHQSNETADYQLVPLQPPLVVPALVSQERATA